MKKYDKKKKMMMMTTMMNQMVAVTKAEQGGQLQVKMKEYPLKKRKNFEKIDFAS